jgi:hypothetical protein
MDQTRGRRYMVCAQNRLIPAAMGIKTSGDGHIEWVTAEKLERLKIAARP